MQEEVSKHGKKIYETIKSPKHSFWDKVKDIIIEIGIIVFAVTLSIWLHGVSEHSHEQKEVKEFLKGLKDDLSKDVKQLETSRNVIARLDSNYRFILSLKEMPVQSRPGDTAISRSIYFDLRITRPAVGRYEGFKSSGKIGLIENDSLKQKILEFYQQIIPDLTYSEEFVNSVQMKILDLQIDDGDKTPIIELVTSPKFMSLLSVVTHNFSNNLRQYNDAIERAKKIIAEIEKE